MLDIIILSFSITELIVGFPIFAIYLTNFLKYRAKNTGLTTLYLLFIGLGIFWGDFRCYYLLTSGPIPIAWDLRIFLLTTPLIFAALFVLVELSIRFTQKSIQVGRTDLIIRIFYLLVIPVLSILNIFNFEIRPSINSGIYGFQVNLIFIPIYLILYLPIILFFSNRFKKASVNFKNKETYRIFIVYVIFFVFSIFERLLSTVYTHLYGNSTLAILLNLIARFSMIMAFCILLIKYGDFLEYFGVFFSLKAFYLIYKDGQTFYGYDFEAMKQDLIEKSDDLLLGGFIYAISEGLKVVLKYSGDVQTIKMGNITLILTHGSYVSSVLLSTDYSPILQKKLDELVKLVETNLKTTFENWTGEITIFYSPESNLEQLVWEIFR